MRPFSLGRKSSDLTLMNAGLQRRLEDLEVQLDAKTVEVEEAQQRAQDAEEKEARIKELGRKFWLEEWRGMKEYLGLIRDESGDVARDLGEIEERILREYRELFGEVEKNE
jgi:hypothetical protein